MRKTISALFIFVAILFPIVLSSCYHLPTPVLVDSDKDGVPDNYDYRHDFTIPQYYDKCPGTPIGVKVDQYGCPLDTDKDGVPDYLDKCPGTPIGVKVDQDGCFTAARIVLMPEPDGKINQISVATAAGSQILNKPWEATELVSPDLLPSKPKVMDENEVKNIFKDVLEAQPSPDVFIVYFNLGSAELISKSLQLIPEILEAIKSQGSNHVSVIGHTDTIASIEYNRRLSRLRAKSVADILVSKGIDRAIIEIEFHGKEKLLIETPDGVPEPGNRRVEIIVK